MVKVAVGIDIGGTNTVIGLVTDGGECVVETNVATAEFPTATEFVDHASTRIRELAASISATVAGIGIGAPNGNYYRGSIEHAPNLRWKGIVPLADLFRKRFTVPVFLTNDANAAAVGEGLFGAARGMRDYIVITLGTGVGSGIVCGGELLYGHDGFAGEIGHAIVDTNGRECGCGRRGCLETYASAGGIKRTLVELLATRRAESKFRGMTFEGITAHAIAEAAIAGDEIAREAFEYTGKILGWKLADAVAHTSPEAIILFGGLAQAGELIFEPARRWMEEHMLNIFKGKVKLLPSGLMDKNIAVLGAAALIWK